MCVCVCVCVCLFVKVTANTHSSSSSMFSVFPLPLLQSGGIKFKTSEGQNENFAGNEEQIQMNFESERTFKDFGRGSRKRKKIGQDCDVGQDFNPAFIQILELFC